MAAKKTTSTSRAAAKIANAIKAEPTKAAKSVSAEPAKTAVKTVKAVSYTHLTLPTKLEV